MDEALLIFHIRASRRKARIPAIAEAMCLLENLGAGAPEGGPLSEKGGIFWVTLPSDSVDGARDRLPRLGYTEAVDLLDPLPRKKRSRRPKSDELIWKGQPYKSVCLYRENAQSMREKAPDRRLFAYSTVDGEVRSIRGYRGGGDPLNRRGLPVCDARLLVNLVYSGEGTTFLDPFAGVGGVTLEASGNGYLVLSCDTDMALRYGLAQAGNLHCVSDARRLPLRDETVSAISTEPPYHPEAEAAVIGSIEEMHRVLKRGGRISMLCASWQSEGIRKTTSSLGMALRLDCPIDRKNLECVVLSLEKM